MDRKGRIKRAKILIVIAVISAAAYFIYKYNKDQKRKWSGIDQSYMNDFDGDGESELLVIYDYHKKKSPMKLVDIPSGETIWKSSCNPSHIHNAKRIVVSDGVLIIAYNDYVNNPYGDDYSKSNIGAQGFDCKTGKQLWDVKMDPNNDFSLYFYLTGDNDNVLFHSVNFKNSISYLTSLCPKTGKTLWEVAIPCDFMQTPLYLYENNFLLRGADRLHKLNFETGDTTILSNKFWIRDIFKIDDSSFYTLENSKLFKYDSILQVVMFNSDTVNINKDTSKYFTDVALYNKSLIAIDNDYHENRSEIRAFPFDSTGTSFSYIMEDGCIGSGSYWSMKGYEPKQCGFYNPETRYVPFIKRRKIDSVKEAKQIMVFDLEKGTPTWQSHPFIKQSWGFYASDIFYYKGHYVICFNTRLETNHSHTLILFDGTSGKFEKAITFNFYACNDIWDGFDKFAGDYFYGKTNSVAWCLNYPELDLVYSTVDSLKTIDNRENIEEILGEIPWE